MTGRRLKGLLCLEAALCLILGLALRPAGGVPSVLAFPFAPLGRALRALSLSGGAGNVCALILYALFCLLPAGALLALVWFLLRPLAALDRSARRVAEGRWR